MQPKRYKSEEMVEFATKVLTSAKIGFPRKQAHAAAIVLVEADLRGDPAHGLVGGSSLDDILIKVNDDEAKLDFKRMQIAEYTIDKKELTAEGTEKYPAIITVDAHGTLGHYVAMDVIPEVIKRASTYGIAKAHIRNSTHFGDCAIYTELIAEQGYTAVATSTTPQWSKPFIKIQTNFEDNENRYNGVTKRFGTNPISWSIPYDNGIITIDMAATQRAVSPAVGAAKDNAQLLGIEVGIDNKWHIGVGENRIELTKNIHLDLSATPKSKIKKKLEKLGYPSNTLLTEVQEGLLKGPNGENIFFPLAFDSLFKQEFWVAPLGGDIFGYKGFGLNMCIELDNVIGGGYPGLIRQLNELGEPSSSERISQTIQVQVRDYMPGFSKRLNEAVETTKKCGNRFMVLPGQIEQKNKAIYLKSGVPYAENQIKKLELIGEEVGVSFNVEPVK